MNFVGIKPRLSVQQADALTMLTHVLYFLFLLISYVNYSIGRNPNLTLI